MTKSKIRCIDDEILRERLDTEYEDSTQIELCKYALLLSKHILETVHYPDMENDTIKAGFLINEQWQKGNARIYDVRQSGFKIHQMAKESEDELIGAALRVVGHAVSTAHMKEHAMVASDYAVKVINLSCHEDIDAVKSERLWQINCLKGIRKASRNIKTI